MTLSDYIAHCRALLPLCETDEDARWLSCVIAELERWAARG